MRINFFIADNLKWNLINDGYDYNSVVETICECLDNKYDSEEDFEKNVREILVKDKENKLKSKKG